MNDLLVALALACPFIAITVLLWDDVVGWFAGGGVEDEAWRATSTREHKDAA